MSALLTLTLRNSQNSNVKILFRVLIPILMEQTHKSTIRHTVRIEGMGHHKLYSKTSLRHSLKQLVTCFKRLKRSQDKVKGESKKGGISMIKLCNYFLDRYSVLIPKNQKKCMW